MHVIRIIGSADGQPDSKAGQFIRDFDPNYANGRGLLTTTEHRRRAKRFPDAAAAWAYWRQSPADHPTRADGKPNRPLTAYTVAIEPHNQTD